jgi:phage terminase large subunit GpA-like protein
LTGPSKNRSTLRTLQRSSSPDAPPCQYGQANWVADVRRFTVPQGGLVLACGIDVQDNRFELVTWAIGRGEEMWAVDYSVIMANPADEREWEEKLDPYLDTVFTHASGQGMRIEAAAIDTMGHFTHQAYNYCRTRERRRVFAVRGDSQTGKPIKGKRVGPATGSATAPAVTTRSWTTAPSARATTVSPSSQVNPDSVDTGAPE